LAGADFDFFPSACAERIQRRGLARQRIFSPLEHPIARDFEIRFGHQVSPKAL
jgi:hypothetical protein